MGAGVRGVVGVGVAGGGVVGVPLFFFFVLEALVERDDLLFPEKFFLLAQTSSLEMIAQPSSVDLFLHHPHLIRWRPYRSSQCLRQHPVEWANLFRRNKIPTLTTTLWVGQDSLACLSLNTSRA